MMKQARAWQRMLSGRRLDLLDPSPLDVEIDDIAHGLSRVARWNGQTVGDWPFSVAEHSVLVEALVAEMEPGASKALRLIALLHDAPEYVIGDLISPFKAAVGADYRALEDRLFGAVLMRFGLPGRPTEDQVKAVKKADKVAAYLEAVGLAGFSEEEADKIFGRPRRVDPEAWLARLDVSTPVEAKARFLARFEALSGARAG